MLKEKLETNSIIKARKPAVICYQYIKDCEKIKQMSTRKIIFCSEKKKERQLRKY
jgi:hypothetical protein